VDAELHAIAGPKNLALLAAHGLRGELAFAVPLVLTANPRLIGYYRLLLGYSRKEFYEGKTGVGSFKSGEERGVLSARDAARLGELCNAFAGAARELIADLSPKKLSVDLLDDLTLLTYGPQLRGAANVERGVAANDRVFQLIREVVAGAIEEQDTRQITLVNAAGRKVRISFSSDPDIRMVELLSSNNPRNVIAIEIKGGTDYSNVHNRIGEAEKSHVKARKAGFVECWTIVNVDGLDDEARRQSPSTDRFYVLAELELRSGANYDDFAARVAALAGVHH
jgi:hypothetical protein